MMKAVVYDSGQKLICLDVPEPRPADDEVLIEIANTGFCGSDHTLIESGGLKDGDILGHEVSGVVVETGQGVSGVPLGQKVIIRPTSCGRCSECLMNKPYLCRVDRRAIGLGNWPGGFAEYLTADPRMLIPIPEGVDSKNAALAEAFAAAMHGISVSKARSGSALVMGGGAIGQGVVCLLKLMGFDPVALSEPVPEKRALARQFGADLTIDPLTEKLAIWAMDETKGKGFDTVFECSGVPDCVQEAVNVAAIGGVVCIVSIIFNNLTLTPMILNFKEIWLTASYSNTHQENRQVLEWMAQGRLDGRPLISDAIPLDRLPDTYHHRIHPGEVLKVMLEIGAEF